MQKISTPSKISIYVVLIILSFTTLFPLYMTILTSFMKNEHILAPVPNLIPKEGMMTLDNYRFVFSNTSIGVYLFNSVFVTFLNVFLGLLTSSMAAYAVTKLKFWGSKVLYKILLSSMMLPGMVMIVPTYLLMYKIDFLDSLLSLIVPGALSVYGIFFMRAFFIGAKDNIAESARIDGSGELRIFFVMYLPQVKAGLMILGISFFNGSWNNYLMPNLFLQSEHKKTLVVALKNIMSTNGEVGVTMAFSLLF
ncbi:MAG: carbohydrate ABC transporter permease, partial [Christensenellales bacterium]